MSELDYDKMVFLDAENLAKAGILESYKSSLLPELQKFVPQPAQVEKVIDHDVGRYAVKCGTREFVIYAPDLDDKGGESWGRATVAFFTIINVSSGRSEPCSKRTRHGSSARLGRGGCHFLTPGWAPFGRERFSSNFNAAHQQMGFVAPASWKRALLSARSPTHGAGAHCQ